MALMNGARLGIAAQSAGLCHEAYKEALAYARERAQFNKTIIDMPPVYDMLARMKAKVDASRSLLYQTARYVDIYKTLEDIQRERKLTPEERDEHVPASGRGCQPLHQQRHLSEHHEGDAF